MSIFDTKYSFRTFNIKYILRVCAFNAVHFVNDRLKFFFLALFFLAGLYVGIKWEAHSNDSNIRGFFAVREACGENNTVIAQEERLYLELPSVVKYICFK